MTRVLIADDHPIFRRGLKEILAEEKNVTAVGEAKDGYETLELARKHPWDVLLLDIAMPGVSGIEVLKILRQDKPRLSILILTAYPENQFAIRVFKAGAAGYITKEEAPDQLLRALRKVLSGGKYVSETLAEQIAFQFTADAERPLHETLSDREYQVMRMLASGRTVKEIASSLALSVRTVSTYRARVLTKMQMRSNADLTRYSLRQRLID